MRFNEVYLLAEDTATDVCIGKKKNLYTYQYVSTGNSTEPQILNSSLLQLNISILQLTVTAQHILNRSFDFWKQVHKLDVGRQKQSSGRNTT